MAAAVAFFALALAVGAETAPRPHLIFFMVDDWGWANVGYHRNESGTPPLSEVQTPHEVQTPNIDALVAEGVELDRQ
jgi:arylsulfatase I/J